MKTTEPSLHDRKASQQTKKVTTARIHPIHRTAPIHCNDVDFLRHPGKQAFAVVFIAGGSSMLEPGNEERMFSWDDLYVLAKTRDEALNLAREALDKRCNGAIVYTVLGVFYVDQLLAMAQRAHRTTAGIINPVDPTNSDDPPHESIEAFHE